MKTPLKKRRDPVPARLITETPVGRLSSRPKQKEKHICVTATIPLDLREEFKYYCWAKDQKSMNTVMTNMIRAYVMRKRDV